MIREYKDIFVSPEQEIRETKLIEFSIKLEDNAKPVRQRVQPLNPKQEADLRKQIDLGLWLWSQPSKREGPSTGLRITIS